MKEQLETLIRKTVKNPNEGEIKEILEIFTERYFFKGDFFKKNNTVSKELGFITSGSARLFIVKNNGDEITERILQKNNFIIDLISFRTCECTPIAIEFLENSAMLISPISRIQKLLEHNLTCNILLREYMTDNAVEMRKLHFLFLTGNAKERYRFILENNSNLLRKFPLRFIASMIGITPTQLSRIRKEKAK